MTDERNDRERRDDVDRDAAGQTPPPLIPPPVRRPDTGEQPYADQSQPASSEDPVFVEPSADRPDDSDLVFSDADDRSAAPAQDSNIDARAQSDDSRAVDERAARDEPFETNTARADERPADPAYEERPVDEAPVVATAYSERDAAADTTDDRDAVASDTDRHPLAPVVDRGISVTPAVDPDATSRIGDDRDTASAREVAADREAVRETSADAEPVTVAHPQTAPDAAPSPVFVPASQGGLDQTAAYPAAPAYQREFVQPPVEPKKKGNRGVGSFIALLSVILFAIIYALIAAAIIASQRPQDLGEIFIAFVQNPVFWIPAIIFVIAFVIVVLLANRAAWWAYVLGSLLVGALVYFGTIGVALVIANPTTLTPDDARQLITQRAIDPFLITAALVAREVSLWTGSAIASRGRRMKARNLTAREEYERASAEHRAEYERSYSPAV